MRDPVQNILARLGDAKPSGTDRWQAKCPAHEDTTPSLSIKRGEDGRALLHCHAGCSVERICAQLGITVAELFAYSNGQPLDPRIATTYPYRDKDGALLYEVVRFVPKSFRQRRPHPKRVWDWNMHGVQRVNEHVRGRHVCIIADKDKAGRDHARKVATSLGSTVSSVRVVELPGDGVKDACDWFAAGGTAE